MNISSMLRLGLPRVGVESTSQMAFGRSRPFSTTLAMSENKRKKQARLVRKANLEKRAKLREAREAARPDPVLGYAVGRQSVDPWEGSFLKSLILDREDVWAGRVPRVYNFGLVKEDVEGLLQTLPEVSAAADVLRAEGPESLEGVASAEEAEAEKAEKLRRIVDLRNASSKGIYSENVRRIVDAFARRPGDTASPEVQAALLTFRIRELLRHLIEKPKDIHSQRPLRQLVQDRRRVLRYLRREDEKRYQECLVRIGVDPSAVEEETYVSHDDLRKHLRPI